MFDNGRVVEQPEIGRAELGAPEVPAGGWATRNQHEAKAFAQPLQQDYSPSVADVFTKAKRSRVMAAIRSKGNKETEMKLARIFRRHRISGWRRHLSLVGNPDFVFRKQRLTIFVDGCFWHGCPKHLRMPRSHQAYWLQKIARNRRRDWIVTRALRREGWRVLRIWGHELNNVSKVAARVLKLRSGEV